MRTVISLPELRKARQSLGGSVGLVPTMGALHDGHLSLINRARAESDNVAVSIFVNPTQFGPHEDFDAYPRNKEHDLELLEKARVDLVWLPAPESVYPKGYQTWINVEEIGLPLEGKIRPRHFRGVATVVAKLFNAFTPDRAYFGQKDAQQVAVIRRMACDLNFPVEIVTCPTVREPDGLALSSRNAYLDPDERLAAAVLFRALMIAKGRYDAGVRDGAELRTAMTAALRAEPLARQEYVSAADPETLLELNEFPEHVLLSLAVRIGKTRLIDNILLP